MSAAVQAAARTGTGVNKAARITVFGAHHASKLVWALASQSLERCAVAFVITGYRAQQFEGSFSLRASWIGGQGTSP